MKIEIRRHEAHVGTKREAKFDLDLVYVDGYYVGDVGHCKTDPFLAQRGVQTSPRDLQLPESVMKAIARAVKERRHDILKPQGLLIAKRQPPAFRKR